MNESSGEAIKITGGAFSIPVPNGWSAAQNEIGEFAAILVANTAGEHHPAVMVEIIHVPSTLSLEQRAVEIKQRATAPDSPDHLFSDSPVAVGDRKGHSFVMGDPGRAPSRRLVVVIEKEKEYDIVFMANQSEFSNYAGAFDDILRGVVWRSEWQTYSTPTGIQVDVPQGWLVVQGDDDHIPVVLLGPEDKGLATNISISVENLNGTFEAFLQSYTVPSKQHSTVSDVMIARDIKYVVFEQFGRTPNKSETRIVNGRTGRELQFTLPHYDIMIGDESSDPSDLRPPESVTRDVAVRRVLIPVGNRVFIISLNGFAESIDRYLLLFDSVVKSVK